MHSFAGCRCCLHSCPYPVTRLHLHVFIKIADVVHVDLNIASAMCTLIAASTEAKLVDMQHEDVCAQLSWWLTAWTAVMLETHHH